MKRWIRGLTFDEYEVGMRFRTASRTITEGDVVNFAGFSGDYNAIHTDEEYAKSSPYRHRIAHGMLGAAVSSGLANRLGIFERTVIALRFQSMQYKRPIHIGDTVTMDLLVTRIKGNRHGSRGTVVFETRLVNQDGKTVIEGQWDLLIKGSGADRGSAGDAGASNESKSEGASDSGIVHSGVSIFVEPDRDAREP